MGIVKLAWRRVTALFTRSSIDREIEKELRLHVDLLAEEYERTGMSSEDARRAALRRFGNVLHLRERGVDIRSFRMLEAVLRDARYGARGLLRTPMFTAIVVLTLAFGIGANTAIFSIVHGFLLRPLPYPDGDRLVALYEAIPGYPRASVSPANWLDWQRESRTFESFAAWNLTQATLTGGSGPVRIAGQKVSAEFFRVMRVEPVVGRTFTGEDDQPGAAPVAIVSHRLWRQTFGEDPAIVGRRLELDGIPHRIVGAMPPAFHLIMRDVDYWVPFALDRDQASRRTEGRFIQVVARVKSSVSLLTAAAEMEAIARRLQIYPSNKDVAVTLVPLREVIGGDVRVPLYVLSAVVGVFLLIACVNVASMLLARSAARTREMAIRASLGAGRGAIVRQLLVESLLLASGGGLGGIVIAYVAANAAMHSDMAQVADVSVDRGVLLYALGLSVVTGVGFGLVPSLTITRRRSAYACLRGDAMPRGGRSRHVLVIAQIAMTVVLLCAGGLLTRSLNVLVGTSTGMDVDQVLTMHVGLAEKRYHEAQRVEFFRQALQRLESLPGVESVAAAGSLPVVGAPLQDAVFHVAGTPLRYASQDPVNGLRASDLSSGSLTGPFAKIRVVTPGYFKTLGIPLAGRDFTEEDQHNRSEPVFIVNAAFARKYLSNNDPLSAHLSVLERRENPYGRVIGVAGDVYDQSPRLGATPTVFCTHAHQPVSGMTLFVRTKIAAGLTHAVAQTVRDLDRNQAVSDVQMLKDALSTSLRLERLAATASSVIAFTALLLAALGVYGLLACIVAERTREIGIRMACGAERATVVRMVLARGLQLIACGSVPGLIGGLAASELIRGFLYGITATDPVTFVVVVVLVGAMGTMAAVVPAMRAARVDPVVALRHD